MNFTFSSTLSLQESASSSGEGTTGFQSTEVPVREADNPITYKHLLQETASALPNAPPFKRLPLYL